MPDLPRVALVTYSTRPRGGVVHTLYLAEALQAAGCPVHVFALGDPEAGFFRPVAVPTTILPAPEPAGTLEERVWQCVETLTCGLATHLPGRYDVVHTQDCIAARAAAALRPLDRDLVHIRTVHHIDDFTTPALVDCQRQAVVEPDHILVVSDVWRAALRAEFGVESTVVPNGVDAGRFAPAGHERAALRRRINAGGRFLFLTVGGIEPRKGSRVLVEAMGLLRAARPDPPLVAVVGGHSFQDHAAYRQEALARASELDLDADLVLVGTVPEDELAGWYAAADAFVFPSLKEGFGLVILEAMAAGLPVVASDIAVFRAFLTERDAVLTTAGDPAALAAGMARVAGDRVLRAQLAAAGPAVAARYTWAASARRHLEVYARAALPVVG
ncbi:MAG TPA: MSMEG_0565 family glycosyltransferase [Actinomycetota bacterium]|nr:MSMEG_0565 family glycosyltransferase [Actinomycetota bacterium]